MTDVPLVSVITVVLNERDRFQRTLDSLRKCNYPRLQYIVIDGGSTDGTLDVIRANEAFISKWISEPDTGISDAFNKGIGFAAGELIGILNAGDTYEPATLDAVAGAWLAHPETDVLCGSIRFLDNEGSALVCCSDPRGLDSGTSVYHPTVFMRRASYQNFGFFDASYRFAMDYELLLRFKRRGAKFLALDKLLATMQLDGVSSRNWYAGLQEVKRARSDYFSFPNVLYYHLRAVLKNLGANALKRGGFGNAYRAYWSSRNRRIVSGMKKDA